MIFGDKLSLFEHVKSKQSFVSEVAKVQKGDRTWSDSFSVSVSASEHKKNVIQTNQLHGLQVTPSLPLQILHIF